MAENFDLIFGQNASQQYAWNDTDYQNGWETIGNIPPTAAQFDALQRRADMKSQELNSRLANVEQSIAGGGGQKREPDTEYTVGTIKTYDDVPFNWVLECIVGGTSGSADITIPSPAVEGARIIDGNVTWALRKIATYGGVGYRQSSTSCPIGSMAFSTALPAGWYLECTTPGTTSAGDLVITSPSVGDTVTDGTVTWTVRKVADTTEATTTTHGLMSASDKTKLNGIEANANNYSLPTASASVKGGIKIGSGLSMNGETLNNTYSYTLPTASTSVKGGIKVGSGLSMSGETLNATGTGFNHRAVITTSGTWTVPTSGYYKVTCIGGGGAGGNGGTGKGGKAGSRGGSTSFGSYLTASGGHSGGGGGEYGSGGGGAAGDVAVAYLSLNAGSSVTVTIGAGGTAPSSGDSGSTTGESGSGGAAGGSAFLGGQGAISAYGSGNSGCMYYVAASSSWYGSVPSGTGGSNGTEYGGGGGGGNSNHSNYNPSFSASGGGNGSAGATITTNESTYPQGGAGGNGAIIIEYYSV